MMGNAKCNDKLPDTLTPVSLQQDSCNDIVLPWGRLYSYVDKFKSVDLKDHIVSFGRSAECNVVVTQNNFPENILPVISKKHFTITRDEYTRLVYLLDKSKNGTYINGVLVGNGKRIIVQNDDVISVGFMGSQKLFVFKLLIDDECSISLPAELRNEYKLSRFLGKGACGEVYLIFQRMSAKAYAMKIIKKGSYSTESDHHLNHPAKIGNEVNILRSLKHDCIVGMKDIYESDTEVYLILEYMCGGELTKRILSIEPLSESNVKFIFYQVALAVQYLHDMGITHRDLKPDNILLASEENETLAKVTDFGLSKFLDEYTMMDTICGTPTYVAPEVIDRSYNEYTIKVDIWSLGVILFYMLSREQPFRAPNRATLNQLILRGQFSFGSKIWSAISPNAKDLVRKMLRVNPIERYSIEQVLRHPWILDDEKMRSRVRGMIENQRFDSDYFALLEDDVGPSPKKRKTLQEIEI